MITKLFTALLAFILIYRVYNEHRHTFFIILMFLFALFWVLARGLLSGRSITMMFKLCSLKQSMRRLQISLLVQNWVFRWLQVWIRLGQKCRFRIKQLFVFIFKLFVLGCVYSHASKTRAICYCWNSYWRGFFEVFYWKSLN